MATNHWLHEDFRRARLKAFWRGWYSRLAGTENDLMSLDEIRQGQPLKGQHYLGWQAVPLDKIVGSEGRRDEFDRAFFPRRNRTRARWVNIDRAHYEQVPLPPVELTKIGDRYFVRDGNHRISVARSHRQDFIDAYVTEIEVSAPLEPTRQARPWLPAHQLKINWQ
jgi:hypothetical protein